MLQHGIGQTELRQSMDAAGGESEIDRASSDGISCTRIGAALKKLDLITPAAEESGQQSSRESATDEREFRSHVRSTVAISRNLPSALKQNP